MWYISFYSLLLIDIEFYKSFSLLKTGKSKKKRKKKTTRKTQNQTPLSSVPSLKGTAADAEGRGTRLGDNLGL